MRDFRPLLIVGLLAGLSLPQAPALADETDNPDIVCLLAFDRATDMAKAELKDPATSPERKIEVQKWLEAIETSQSWFIGRFTALAPSERDPAVVKPVADKIEAIGEEDFLALTSDCIDAVEGGRARVLRKMM